MRAPVDIIARHRGPDDDGREHVAIRWSFSGPWPQEGFNVQRDLPAPSTSLVSAKGLPGATKLGNARWTIDELQLKADFDERTAIGGGPPTPTWNDALALLPLLVFALSMPDEDARDAKLDAVAKLLEYSYQSDLELDTRFWKGEPPDLDQLHMMRNGKPDDQRAYQAVIDHYGRAAISFLIELANDFGMARFLGLGLEDVLLQTGAAVSYTIEVSGLPVSKACLAEPVDANWPPAPDKPHVGLGNLAHIGYPAFARFFAAGAWTPVAPAGADVPIITRTMLAARGPRYVPTPTAEISWTPVPDPKPGDVGEIPLLSRRATGWKIERHDFEMGPAENKPTLALGAPFVSCHEGETMLNQKDHRFVDGLDLPWGERHFEGWYAWRVRGIDLFGIPGPASPAEQLPLRDSEPPGPPRPSLDTMSVTFDVAAGASVDVHVDWDAANELRAPDTAKFRLYQRWSVDNYHALVVRKQVDHDDQTLEPVQAKIEVTDAAGTALDDATLAALIGGTLQTRAGEFAVLSAPGKSTLVVQRSAGRAPPLGDGMILVAGFPQADPLMKEIERMPAITASVDVLRAQPLTVKLDLGGGKFLSPATGTIYLHLTGLSWGAIAANDANAFVLTPPEGGKETIPLLEAMAALDELSLKDWLKGSPALWLPSHSAAFPLNPPSAFQAGRLYIDASAVDDATYVETQVGKGNESGKRTTIVLARSNFVPPRIHPGWVPRIWARDAAEYDSRARVTIQWPAIPGAVRYEVGRALEPALGLTPNADDALMIEVGEAMDTAFERVTDSAFLSRWTDDLPGRAPTRAVYRVRGISAGGLAGEWGLVALVWVPDVRIAPRPSLLWAIPDPDAERGIRCRWTQPGPKDGIGFAIEARPVDRGAVREEGWIRGVDLLPGAIAADAAGRYDFTLADRPLGQWHEYRVIALRHARDPDDPRGLAIRRIAGRPSDPMRARAEGELRPPDTIRASVSEDGVVTVRWTPRDRYVRLEARYRAPDAWRVTRTTLPGDAEQFVPTEKLGENETWILQLAAIGHGCRAASDELEVTRP